MILHLNSIIQMHNHFKFQPRNDQQATRLVVLHLPLKSLAGHKILMEIIMRHFERHVCCCGLLPIFCWDLLDCFLILFVKHTKLKMWVKIYFAFCI